MTYETAEQAQPVYPPIDATKGIPPVTPFHAWTWTTPVIPQFYWNVYSAEQRIRQICTEIGKIQAYLSYFASNSNAAHWYLDERFTETETRLTKRIDELEAELTTEVENLNKRIDEERERAQTAESTLQSNIDNEAAERENADTTLSAKIDVETNRATSAENTIQKNLNTESERAQSAESTLQTNIDTEASERKNADTALSTKIDVETNRATSAENTIQKNLNTESKRAQAAESTLQSNVNKEATERKTADNELESTIRTNKNSSDEADKRLQDSLDTEITNRKNSDNALSERVDTESTARAQADNNLETIITTETSNRTTADNLLTQQVNRRVKSTNITAATDSHITVNSTVSDTDPDDTTVVIGDTFTPEFDKLESGLTAEVTRATSAETELSGRISHETSDRENADNLLNQALSERLKATGVIGGDNITVIADPDATTVTISSQAGISGIEHDNTLTGSGTTESPLRVSTLVIASTNALSEESKARKEADTQLTTELANKLETSNLLAGDNITLTTTDGNVTIASAASGGGLTEVATTAFLDGKGTTESPLGISDADFNQYVATTPTVQTIQTTGTELIGRLDTLEATMPTKIAAVQHDNTITGAGTSTDKLSVALNRKTVMSDTGNTVYPTLMHASGDESAINGIGFNAGDGLTAYNSNDANTGSGLRLSDNIMSTLDAVSPYGGIVMFDWIKFVGTTTSGTYQRKFLSSAICPSNLETMQIKAGQPLGAIYANASGVAMNPTSFATIVLHSPLKISDYNTLPNNMNLYFEPCGTGTGANWVLAGSPTFDFTDGTTITFQNSGSTSVAVGHYFISILLQV